MLAAREPAGAEHLRGASGIGRGAGTTSSASGPTRDSVAEFESSYRFGFDDFQRRACNALKDGSSVLVAAPTGAGKTVVGEFAAWLSFRGGGKTFYTTPIKALSNQKYADFLALYGERNVGLLTGDNSVNGGAPVVVMTTEVLRNMIYEDSPDLAGLHYVVLDEVHYLQDPYRGAVWEEIVIHLPVEVQTVSLSATVSNAEEFGEWLQTLRGRTEVIIEETRPVEIRHWYFASDELMPTFVRSSEGQVLPNPRGREFDQRRRRGAERPGPGGRRIREKRARIPRRSEVIDRLHAEAMLPAIYFIFSRRGCDDAVLQCLRDNVRLTTPQERREITEYADRRVADLTPGELAVLGYDNWIAGLARGVSSHHAGLIPPFKEAVEELFARGLVKVVFATETLALGINMPARTVVIENLMKFTGERHEMMTPGEYTQLSGRAGRRGVDELGHCVVLLQRFTPFDAITRLASTRTYPLQSSFRPSYNMAVNLVRNYDLEEAEHLVNSSFAQFQADRDVVELELTRERLDAYLASYRDKMTCELGDFGEYRALARKLRRLEEQAGLTRGRTKSKRVAEAVAMLRPGDVIQIVSGKRRGRYAVLEVAQRGNERAPRVVALSEERKTVRFAPDDFPEAPRPMGRLRLPRDRRVRDASTRRLLARRLAEVTLKASPSPREPAAPKEIRALARRVETHPVHQCPERGRHIHFAERAERLERELKSIDRRIGRRTGTLARRFEKVLSVLEELGYVAAWKLTERGEILTRVYNESDLLVVEALLRSLFDNLDIAEICAVCSTLVYEARGPDTGEVGEIPTEAAGRSWKELSRLYRHIHELEDARGLDLTREPDTGFAIKAHLWAEGAELEDILREDDAPGDFVRSMKQLIDLLRQLEEAVPIESDPQRFGAAAAAVHRGVVAYSSLGL